jgi:hypothetical protein
MWRIRDSLDSYANHPCLPRPDILPGRPAGCDHETRLWAAALRQKTQWRNEERTSMQRPDFLKSSVALAVAAELRTGKAHAFVPAHNWTKHDFRSGPPVTDRLNQGPFQQYPPDAVIPTGEVVMATTPSEEVVRNYGKGLITYITADMGTEEIKSDNVSRAIEDLVRFPLGQQLYVRPTWREVQPRPERLELSEYLKLVFDLAKKNTKRAGLRVQMSTPDYTHDAALPDFVLDKVPKVDLGLSEKENSASAQDICVTRTRAISHALSSAWGVSPETK